MRELTNGKLISRRIIILIIFLLIGIIFQSGLVADTEEYIIGPEDELEITFWQDRMLNTTVRVGNDGRIVIPVVGSMTAAGLKPSQLSRKIVEKISIYNKSITQASVVVTRYGSNKIYITGQVHQPGKKTFEIIPNLWDAILEAGGPTEEAALNNVTVIRGEFEKGKKIVIDLPQYLNSGEISKLPPLYKGDTVFIPALPNASPNTRPVSPLARQKVIYIYGAVRLPGNYTISEDLTLFQALGLAGSITELADLSKVRIISQSGLTPTITLVNLNDNHQLVATKPIQLNANDTIIVPARRFSGNPGFWNQFILEILTTGASVAITILLYNSF